MERGARAARRLLADIRACEELAGKAGLPVRAAVLAGLIEAALPEVGPARSGFLMILGLYLGGAVIGFPPEPEDLSLPQDAANCLFPDRIVVNE